MAVIDVHTHGLGGCDTRSEDVEHIIRIAELHGSCGVDEIVLAVYPAAIPVMRHNLSVIAEAIGLQGDVGNAECSGTAKIAGVHLEGPFLNPSQCGSLNAMALSEPTESCFAELIEGYEDIVKIVTIAPELPGATALISHMAARGIVVSMGHSDATYVEAERGYRSGARGITHIFNAMRSLHHREPGIAGFGLVHPDVYVEVIADPYHLHPATLDLIFRVKRRDRIIIVSDSVRGTKISQSSTAEGVADSRGRLLGGAITVTEAARSLFEQYGDTTIMECISENPARYLS